MDSTLRTDHRSSPTQPAGAQALGRYLAERGYARHTASGYVHCAAHFLHWAERSGVATAQIDESFATAFLDQHLTRCQHLLQSGVAFNVIALWLGHESPNTTHRYVEADLAMKEKALARIAEPATRLHRYRPPDALLTFLQQL
jgi:site-specific recombinase XerD